MITLDKPRDGDLHTVADFAELLCLITTDRVCSRESISDQIKDVGDGSISENDLDDCFLQLSWRANAYGEHYPFLIDNRAKTFSALENLTEPQKLYAFLLLCSNLPFLHDMGTITDAFERLALNAYKRFWPTTANVKAFGKNETDYTGAKWKRINQLAQDIGGQGLCTDTTYRKKDSGDGGIDLVAWFNLDTHESRNIPSALAQCACSRTSWVGKQTEMSRDRLNGAIHPSHPWSQLMFIPHSFRNNHGRWAVDGEIASCIIYDRLRLIGAIDHDIDWAQINPPGLFHDFLVTRLDLV